MTAIENVSLVREASSPAIYLVAGDTKFWIVDTAEFAALGFRWDRVRVVSDGSLRRFRESLLMRLPESVRAMSTSTAGKPTMLSTGATTAIAAHRNIWSARMFWSRAGSARIRCSTAHPTGSKTFFIT